MELKKRDIENLSNEKIYSNYSLMFNKLYKDYRYLEIEKKDFYDMMLDEINISRDKYNDNEIYSGYLKERINKRLISYINNLMSTSKKSIKIINNFINTNLIGYTTNDYIIYYLNVLDEFFSNVDYFPNPDDLIEIIKNKTLQKLITKYVNNKLYNQKNFNNGLYGESIVGMIIDTYCKMFEVNIDLNETTYDKPSDITSYDDSLKIYMNEIKPIPPLTITEETKYGYELLNGSEYAKEKLIKHNLKLVIGIAQKYTGYGIQFEDLIQEGNEGLITAANKFNIKKKCLFSTYAAWWIKNRILSYISLYKSIIRLSEDDNRLLRKYKNEVQLLAIELGREPTDQEVAIKMCLTSNDIEKIKQKQFSFISLNSSIHPGEEREMSEIISVTEDSIDDNAINLVLPNDLKRLLDSCGLTEKERNTLILRYGLNGEEPKTLEAVGEILGNITRERVRQLEHKALKKIRTSEDIEAFAIYMDNPDAALKRLSAYRKEYDKSAINTYKSSIDVDYNMKRIKRRVKKEATY